MDSRSFLSSIRRHRSALRKKLSSGQSRMICVVSSSVSMADFSVFETAYTFSHGPFALAYHVQ
jgi:hypothetical protein